MSGLYSVWLCMVLGGAILAEQATAAEKPNIIIFLADDLGHDDLSFLGSRQIPTPNIDALAYDGIILDRYYVHRICTPSRAALLTGRHPMQLGLQQGVVLSAERYGLGLNETLLPQYLKPLGYSTNIVGKWHLGFFAKEYMPTYRGFDHFFGFLQGHEDYYDHTFKSGDADWGFDLRNDTQLARGHFGEYGTDIFTREAVRIIENHNPDQPLLLYFPQQGVHAGNEQTPTPLEAPWRYVKNFQHIHQKQRRIYAGMVSAVDDSVGNITKALHAKGMLNNSIIIFSTDNGGPAAGYDMNQACNWPLRGTKYTLWEGGIRGAGFIWSPLLKKSGYVSRHQIQIEDFLPSLLHAVGYDTRKLPRNLYGKDLWDMLSNDGDNLRQEMIHNINNAKDVKALRMGDMKLIMSEKDGITATNDGWFYPPQVDIRYERFSQLSESDKNFYKRYQNQSSSSADLKQYLSEMAPDDLYESDIPQLLQDIGRPSRLVRSPVYPQCGSRPVNVTSFCVVWERPCLFNVTEDPCEYRNLATSRPQVVAQMLQRLKWYERWAAPPKNKPEDPRGRPRFHNGTWGPWVELTYQEVALMKAGLIPS